MDAVDILLIKCRIFLIKICKWNVSVVTFLTEVNNSKVEFEKRIRKAMVNVTSLDHPVYSLMYMFFFCQCLIIMISYKVVEGNIFIVALTVPQPAENFVVLELCKINHSTQLA